MAVAQAAPSLAAARLPAAPAASRWILSRWRDLALFVATPALLLPLFALAQTRWTAQDIYLFVAAFGAMGHHLPGMIRAYGDPSLFERFRTRFIFAPIAIVGICALCSVWGVKAMEVVAFVWGIWHGMMQTYGFARIYDSKASGALAARRARADFLFCLTWFAAGVVLSPMRMRTFLDLFYESGGPAFSANTLEAVRIAMLAAVGLVTLVFAWQHVTDWRRGRGLSGIKLLLLATSLAFWWYCNNGVANILVGIALFEVFHDVQYLSIVWLYNQNRVERDPGIGGFLRFVFRRSGSLVGLYVGLVFAYGAIALLAGGVPSPLLKQVLLGVVTASAILHFYYDGFIWKVRESSTRQSLGIDPGAGGPANARPRFQPWLIHGSRWALLVVPFATLCFIQLTGRAMPLDARRAVVAQTLPSDAQAQLNYGMVLHEQGRVDEAVPYYEAAKALNPNLSDLEYYLGLAASDRGEIPDAAAHYRRAIELDPKSPSARANLGAILVEQRKPREAREQFERSIAANPQQAFARAKLADLLIDEGEYAEAVRQYSAALNVRPQFPEARDGLARAQAFLRK